MAFSALTGSGADISASALRICSRTSSRPRADRMRSSARVSRSPVLGSCGRYPTVPECLTVPAAGVAAPESTLARVVLPAPFRPIRPIRSPSATWKDASASRSRAPARSSMPLATIMITKNTGSRRRFRDAYPHRGEQLRRALEDGPPRVGDGQEPLRRDGQVRGEPRVVTQPRDRPLVPAEDDRVQPGAPAEDGGRRVRRSVKLLIPLLSPAAGEALLRPAARRAAA